MAKKKVNKKKSASNASSRLSVVYMKQQYAPNTSESAGDDYISYGDTAPYFNTYPQFLIDLYNSSPVHRAITDSASNYIAGKGILIEDESNIEATNKLKSFLLNINSKETIEGLLSKIGKDLYLQGAFALNIIYSKDRTSIVSITHIAAEKVRIGVPNDNGIVDTYYVSKDWSNIRAHGNEPKPVPAYNPNDRTNPSQIMYVRDYTPGLDLYGAPTYSPASNWALTDSLISEYQLSNVQNGFSGTTWINFNDGHRVVSPALMGVKTEGQLGGKNELLEAYELYSRSVIQPYQDIIVKSLSKLFAVNGIFLDFKIKDVAPFANRFGTDVLKEVLTVDELREELGLEPLTVQEETIEENNTNLSKQDILSVEEITELLRDLGENEEDILDNYDMLSEESLDGETEEEDLELQLNNREDFAADDVKTGKAYPNRTSKQDGTSKQSAEKGNIFRVRYVYTGNAAPERNFCKAMMKAKKVYTKENILAMSTRKVNPGWGPKGKNTYSIWLSECSNDLQKFYKGGGNCKHKWQRRIYLQKGKRAKNTDDVITTTSARSRGYKTPPNPDEVFQTPNSREDKGFLK